MNAQEVLIKSQLLLHMNTSCATFTCLTFHVDAGRIHKGNFEVIS